MKKKFNKNLINIAISLAVVWGVIIIAKSGYVFGQWLFAMIH